MPATMPTYREFHIVCRPAKRPFPGYHTGYGSDASRCTRADGSTGLTR